MRPAFCIFAFSLLLIIFSMTIPVKATDAYFVVDDITMTLTGADAIFVLNYTLDSFAKLYVLALGAAYIEQDLKSILKSYQDVTTVRVDMNSAEMLVKNAGKNSSGYYLFDSRPMGSSVAKFTVVYPSGLTRTFRNVTSTPNVFYAIK
jgi:hypothetical protein